MEPLINELRIPFPEVELGRIFFSKQNIWLEEQHGFLPSDTHFAEGGCSDEINEAEYLLLENYWGERFKFGGLAGYCHGGKTGLIAGSHHVPTMTEKQNLILVAGPHIGYHRGQWGKVPRVGQADVSNACGSLCAVLQTGYEAVNRKETDPLDRQQQVVESLMLPYLKLCADEKKSGEILDATRFLLKRVDDDLTAMVKDLKDHFDGKIALVTGITINTESANYFSPSIVEIFG